MILARYILNLILFQSLFLLIILHYVCNYQNIYLPGLGIYT